MKILSNKSFRATCEEIESLKRELVQSERVSEQRLKDNGHLKKELNRIGDKLVASERELNKYRPRRGKGGKFEKK